MFCFNFNEFQANGSHFQSRHFYRGRERGRGSGVICELLIIN